MSNKKKVAWITGGGSGIGYAGAEALAKDGWTVVICGRRAEVIEEAAKSLSGLPGKVTGISLDVTDAAAVEKAAQAILAEHGKIDLLVNSAGLNVPNRSWEDMTIDSWDKVIDANLNGALYCIRAVLPSMRAQKDGSIINIASWAGRYVSKNTGPAYTAAKHGVVALSHSLNMSEYQNGIRCCALNPCETATPIMQQRYNPPTPQDLARMLQLEDLGRTIAFVASMPAHVCVNEIVISPTHNRAFGAP